ncbi:hypothetical protein [Olsenella profusa]|uniref:Uncharacterized protein n=1 Tax=Olsenella profusa TaxID=138595 RepID=A0ABS2F261_9ACTN|nr:hypothetical protein [Olsenella profusa]MBM6774913.1 hypothetical protein [Olsenella profusa]
MATNGELVQGGEAPSAAEFVKGWKAYLSFELFALDEASSWADAVGNRPWMNQEGAQAIVDAAAAQQQTRSQMIELIEKYEGMFYGLADRALTGTCECGCAGDVASGEVDLTGFSGTYRRVGDTERTWSTFDVAPADGGLTFSHEAEAGYRMLSLTNYQPVMVAFDGGEGSIAVESLDYGNVTLAITLNDDGSFDLACGIAELDGTYVPEDTPTSSDELTAQGDEDASLASDTLAWLTSGTGVWMLDDPMANAGVVCLALAPDGTVTRWLYGYGGAEGTGTFSLDGDNITFSLTSLGGKDYGQATYVVRQFTSGDERQIRLDPVTEGEGPTVVGDLSGWYTAGDVWW